MSVEPITTRELDALADKAAIVLAPIFAAQGWVWDSTDNKPPDENAIRARLAGMLRHVRENRELVATATGRLRVTRIIEEGEAQETIAAHLDLGQIHGDVP